MNPTSEVLAQTASIDVPANWTACTETEEVIPYHTDYYRKCGRPSMKEKAQGQQYLIPPEEKALIAFILRMSAVGTLYVSSIYPHLLFVSPVDVLRTEPPNHRTRIGLRSSVAVIRNSN
ncbi:hypothetical protein ACJQWK_02904 [Exserohilum turcicum]